MTLPINLEYFQFHFVQIALVAIVLTSILCGLLSPIVVLKQRSYVGDTLSHLIFPGVVFGILLTKFNILPIWAVLLLSSTASAFLGTFLLEWLVKKLKIPSDAAAIISLTSFLAIGIIAISSNQDSGAGMRISPESILFGDVLTLNWTNVVSLGCVCIFVLLSVVLLRKHWDAWLSDSEFARVVGFKVKLLDKLFPIMLTLSVLSGLFAVGGFIISALITIPAVLYQPQSVFSIGVILNSLCIGLTGILLAFNLNWPVGPSVVFVGFIAVVLKSFFIKRIDKSA